MDWQALSDVELEQVVTERAVEQECVLAVRQRDATTWEARFDRPGDEAYYGTSGEAPTRRLALAALLVADDLNIGEGHRDHL